MYSTELQCYCWPCPQNQFCRGSLNGPACEAIHLYDIQSNIDYDTFIPPVKFLVFQTWCSSLPVVESNIRHSLVTFVRLRKSVLDLMTRMARNQTEHDTKSNKFEIENFSFLPKMMSAMKSMTTSNLFMRDGHSHDVSGWLFVLLHSVEKNNLMVIHHFVLHVLTCLCQDLFWK
jgi:hypothetical protein